MTTIRDDAKERMAEALVLTTLIEESQAPEMRVQHLGRLRRLLVMLADSIEDRG